MDKMELLQRVAVFDGLNEEELKKFAAISEEVSFSPGAVIIEEGAEGRALFILKRGTVSVSKLEGETETELAKLVAGDTFGEMSILEGHVTSARVSAYNEVECLMIRKEDLLAVLEQDLKISNQIYRNFTRLLSERLRFTSEELMTWKMSI